MSNHCSSFFQQVNTMKYESEFEIVETINSRVTKLQHRYTRLHHVEITIEKEESFLKIWDMRANHPVGGKRMKSTNYQQNKLELGYVLYTTSGIHPLNLFFFQDITRDLWKGYLLAKGYEHKPYKNVEWFDLLHPLPFYPNLEGFCHVKEPVGSCTARQIDEVSLDNKLQFSVERVTSALNQYQGKLPKVIPDAEDIIVSTEDAFAFVKQRKLEVMSR